MSTPSFSTESDHTASPQGKAARTAESEGQKASDTSKPDSEATESEVPDSGLSHTNRPDSGAANAVVTDSQPHVLELKVPPAVVALLFAAAMWAVDRYYPVFAIEIPFQWPIALVLSAIGVLVGGYSLYLFVRVRTTVHAHKPLQTTVMVTAGPYRHTRNPMYLSLSIVLIAWAIALSDLMALMMMPGFYLYLSRFQIEPEERVLRERFGQDYEEYCKQTPRWL